MRKYFIYGLMSALGISAIASVPREAMQEGVALTDDVSEIRTKRHQELTSDGELHRLGRLQAQYRENLPLMKRSSSTRATAKKPAVRKSLRTVRGTDRRSDRVKVTSASAQRVSPRKAQKRVVTKRSVSRR